MSQNKSIFKEMLERKIPQIIGMYIASAWLAVEISDWLSSRFDLPALFSSYVFVGMIAFLPAIIIVAWGHGRKGKDEWNLFEKIILPINFLAAIFVVNYLVKPIEEETKSVIVDNTLASQMEVRSIIDAQTGSKIVFEVPKKSFHQKVVSYFWDNQTQQDSLSWLSYGASWLLSQDLKRTPFIAVTTAYDSESLLSQIVGKGFEKALKVPLSLALKVARDHSAKWVVQGSYTMRGKLIEFTAKLYNVETGKEIKEITVINENPLTSLDIISDEISRLILDTVKVAKNIIPQLAIAEHTSESMSAIKYLISSKNSVTFSNDYKQAIEFLIKALIEDPNFADANVLSMSYYNALGDVPASIEQAKKALELDYKLYQESEFRVKSNLFALQGQEDKSLKVLENWVKIYPENLDALRILARSYVIKGHHQEQAKEIYTKLYQLEGKNSTALVSLAKIYRLQNNKDEALASLHTYLSANQTKSSTYFELAATYRQFGMFDKAKEMYEEASLYDNKDFAAEIGLANISASQGNITDGLQQLQTVLEQCKTDKQKLDVLANIASLYLSLGQIHKAMGLHEQMSMYGKKVLPPLALIFQSDAPKIFLLTSIGKFDEAEQAVESLLKDLKPPYDKLVGTLSKEIYEKTKNSKKYKKSLAQEQEFIDEFGFSVLVPGALKSKGVLKLWENDNTAALDFFNQAILEAQQSFVILITYDEINNLYLHKAKTLVLLEKYDEALASLDIILLRSPIYANAHLLKATIYKKQGELQKLDAVIKVIDAIWSDADNDYLDYQEYQQFKDNIKKRL